MMWIKICIAYHFIDSFCITSHEIMSMAKDVIRQLLMPRLVS